MEKQITSINSLKWYKCAELPEVFKKRKIIMLKHLPTDSLINYSLNFQVPTKLKLVIPHHVLGKTNSFSLSSIH